MPKTLVLIRHAHRDTTHKKADNGLSDKGRGQAAALLRHYLSTRSGTGSHQIVTSPKRRCVETVKGIAQAAQVNLKRSNRLLEQAEEESKAQFHCRVESFLAAWKAEGPGLTIVCSHGDWLPLALKIATGARSEFKKGAWAEIKLRDGQPVLSWLLQDLTNISFLK